MHKNMSNKVLLIVDNYGPHGSTLTYPSGQGEAAFLTSYVKIMYQPMDVGYISMINNNSQ